MGKVVEFPPQPIDVDRVRTDGGSCQVIQFPARRPTPSDGIVLALAAALPFIELMLACSPASFIWPGPDASRETPDATDCN